MQKCNNNNKNKKREKKKEKIAKSIINKYFLVLFVF
jgi:hypothetical protein